MESAGRPKGHYGHKGGGVVEQEPREYVADVLRDIGLEVTFAGDERARRLKFVPVELRSVGWLNREAHGRTQYRPVFEILFLSRRCDGCSTSERSMAECIEHYLVLSGETVLDALLASPHCEVISNSTPLIGSVEQELPPVPSDLSAIRFRVVSTEENRARIQHTRG